MSEKKKWPRRDALTLAVVIKSLLGINCERIEIAGSIRREKPLVGDIELLYIPKFEDRKDGLFDTIKVNLVDECLNAMLKAGELRKRPSKIGVFTWGKENKLAIHTETGMPVDFFATDLKRWWNALVVRTGGKENNLLLTTTANRRGWSLEAYGAGYRRLPRYPEEFHQTTSERDVYEFIGLPYKEPKDRP